MREREREIGHKLQMLLLLMTSLVGPHGFPKDIPSKARTTNWRHGVLKS